MAWKDIYDIPDILNELEKMFSEEEIDEEEKAKLLNDVLELASKDIESARNFYMHLINKLEVVKYETDRMKSIKKSTENLLDSLDAVFKRVIELNGNKKIYTEKGFISTRRSKSVTILDESLLDDKFITTKPVEKVPNKTAIKDAINSGEEVAGAEITENVSISIK